MIPYEIDPSLYPAQPEPPMLEDGFSAPRSHGEAAEPVFAADTRSLETALASKSDF